MALLSFPGDTRSLHYESPIRPSWRMAAAWTFRNGIHGTCPPLDRLDRLDILPHGPQGVEIHSSAASFDASPCIQISRIFVRSES